MKHRSLIKVRVRIYFIPQTQNCFYIKIFPLIQIFHSNELYWTKHWFFFLIRIHPLCQRANITTIQSIFLLQLCCLVPMYHIELGAYESRNLMRCCSRGLLVFGLSVAGGWLIGRILRQGYLLEIPGNVQSFVEQSQMQKQLIIIKNDNVILTKTSAETAASAVINKQWSTD